MTLFWYDRLLLCRRSGFWSRRSLSPKMTNPRRHAGRSAPSSAVWVLYQNMQRTWRLLFVVPATYATGVGIVARRRLRIEPEGGR